MEKLERLQLVKDAIDKAIDDTINEFLRYPEQFHGDTGISHYLYHCIHKHAGKNLYSSTKSPVPDILLLQSEHYTQQLYRNTGTEDSGGKFDFAFMDEDTLQPDKPVSNKNTKALIAIEVGLNKSIEKAIGTITSNSDEQSVRPADITKVIREIKSYNLRYGYILEFFSAAEERKAIQLLQELKKHTWIEEIKGWTVLIVRAKDFQGEYRVERFPSSSGEMPVLPIQNIIKYQLGGNHVDDCLPTPSFAQGEGRAERSLITDNSRKQKYQKACSPCNKILQKELEALMNRHSMGVKPNYGLNNMSLARPYRIKVSNLNQKPERIYDIEENLIRSFKQRGIPIYNNEIRIPQNQDNNEKWVMNIINVIEEFMDKLTH